MNVLLPTRRLDFKAFFLFCGIGGNASGFDRVNVRVGHLEGLWRCVGAVDSDAAAVRDFQRLVRGPATCLDLFDRGQYEAFHGRPAGDDWREATVDDIRAAAHGERPDCIFTSPPCKGFSGLLSEQRSTSEKYQALNRLTLRGIKLTLEAWADDPPSFFILENVPRIATRGRALLDAIVGALEHHGYSVAETVHDCGEIGGLAQTRKRFLLVARHRAKVPPFLYQPPRKPLRGVGEALGGFPLPGAAAAGPMHRMRELQAKTWIRLAFVKAGGDWRSLKDLRVVDGHLADYVLIPERYGYPGALGVTAWGSPSATVTGEGHPSGGRFAVADPRIGGAHNGVLGVTPWTDPAGVVAGASRPGNGGFSVADPRCHGYAEYSQYGVLPWTEPSGAVSGQSQPGGGRYAVADPRLTGERPRFNNVYRVARWEDVAPAVTGGEGPSAGGVAVADPRPGLNDDAYKTAGHYGVVPWDATSRAVTGTAGHDNGPFSVADPRLPAPDERLVMVIRSLDGTWHRPFTTLELAALQGLVEPGEAFELEGSSDSAWRERIGNAIPRYAAEAIGNVMAYTLLLVEAGETFVLSPDPIWCRPGDRDLITAVAVETPAVIQ